MRNHVSPRELARAIGVSESSLKRWADEGRLAVERTPGGHRRIPLAEAARFIRRSGVPVRHPDVLTPAVGAEPVAVPPPSAAPAGEACDRLFELLTGEEPAAARAYVAALFLAGWPPALIFDGPMRNALTRIGELWHHDVSGVFVEHRATQTCVEALVQLRGMLPAVPRDAPLALGCAPAGDPYLIPSRMASLVLASAGYRDHDLGPDTPLPALHAAIARHRPAVVWLALSTTHADGRAAHADLTRLADTVADAGGVLVVGGRGAAALPSFDDDAGYVCATMAELAAFVAGRKGATVPAQ